ncbi:hypothetical protein EJ06DRAFT_394509 [Trichodelitschia bisporula]|uniref:DUF7603 domain-containing protein n=1 Tax=Trichodelitschia bisporula TaxID=703511 RepID=A0A6G1I0A4_9PEZI|nr:hypothetical protein EJ06DRAFT_394509 [Trichodelitschia bisporula]
MESNADPTGLASSSFAATPRRSQESRQPKRPKKLSLPGISFPLFPHTLSAFHIRASPGPSANNSSPRAANAIQSASAASSGPSPSTPPVRSRGGLVNRKPLPSTASPIAAEFGVRFHQDTGSGSVRQDTFGLASRVNANTLDGRSTVAAAERPQGATQQNSSATELPSRPAAGAPSTLQGSRLAVPSAAERFGEGELLIRDLDRNPHGTSPLLPPQLNKPPVGLQTDKNASAAGDGGPQTRYASLTTIASNPTPAIISPVRPQHSKGLSYPDIFFRRRQRSTGSSQHLGHSHSKSMAAVHAHSSSLRLDPFPPPGDDDLDPRYINKNPKSPSTKFTSFFGWSRRTPSGDSPTTTFSDRSPVLPSPLPHTNSFPMNLPSGVHKPAALDIPRANAGGSLSYYGLGTPGLPSPPVSSSVTAELEQQLRELSSELTNSIKRELELEDEVERWKANIEAGSTFGSGGLDANRRTSDYYSDSGTSSVRFPLHGGDGADGKLEELERIRRRAEQEKAQLKLDMTQRLQESLRARQEAEERVHSLEERIHAQARGQLESERVRELELMLDELKRKLGEERQFRENVEDLIGGMRMEGEAVRNDRDELRDEVIPQLKARVEALEHEVAEKEALTYEHSRVAHELRALREENQTLKQAQQQQRFRSIAEEDIPAYPLPPPSPQLSGLGLSRSKSLATKRPTGRVSRSNSGAGSGALSRSNSVKHPNGPPGSQTPTSAGPSPGLHESREALAERVKETEQQREALHSALKTLLERYSHEAKVHQRRLKQLEAERDRAQNLTPRRTAFYREVRGLREEIQVLRRRADDALEQKWMCEKGLGGLKMDLDRAREETSSLRVLLNERGYERGDDEAQIPPAGALLDTAYNELRTTQALSLARVRAMEGAGADDARILALLKQSISDAEAERAHALDQAESYRAQARALQDSPPPSALTGPQPLSPADSDATSEHRALATELYAAARRMDVLAEQVAAQMAANTSLRARLAEAIGRGEREQERCAERIATMQGRLRELEERVMAAQARSEGVMAGVDEDARLLREADHAGLVRGVILPPGAEGAEKALFGGRGPVLAWTRSGVGMSIGEVGRTEILERRVAELEKALGDAEGEMEEVVQRMNRAQIEVGELQGERDEAMMRTRRLQAEIVSERAKVQALMA